MATSDLARKLRSSILLEDQLVPESEFGLPTLRNQLKEAKGKYRARHLAGYALPDMVRANAEAVDPSLKLTSAGQEARYTDPKYTDPKSDTYLGPDTIRALASQQLQGGRDYLSRVTDKIGRLYDKDTEAARTTIDDLSADVTDAEGRYGKRLTRAQALIADEEAAAAAARSGGGGGGGGTGSTVTSGDSAPVFEPGIELLADSVASGQSKLTDYPQGDRKQIVAFLSQTGQQIVPKEARTAIQGLSAAKGVIDELEKLSNGINTGGSGSRYASGITNFLGGLTQTKPDAALFASARKGFLATLARASGERGVLTDQDVKRAEQLLPNIFDSKVVARKKIAQLRKFVGGLESRATETYTTKNPGSATAPAAADPLGIR